MEIREPSPQEELEFAAKALDAMVESALQHGFLLRSEVLEAMLLMIKGKKIVYFPERYK